MKTIRKYAAVLVVMAAVIGIMGCKLVPYVHTYSEEWSRDAEYHWHKATCIHTKEVSDKAKHEWNHEEYQYDSKLNEEIRFCNVCNYTDKKTHIHAWDYTDFHYDSISKKDKRTCTVCNNVEERAHVHIEDNGTVEKASTVTSPGVITYKCSACDETTKKELFCGPLDESGNKATSSSKYVYFGVFPKTVKASSVLVDEDDSMIMGANTYYKGSDGEWYAKVAVAETQYDSYYKYSDGTEIHDGYTYYFKVEPIKWKVLTKDYNGTNKALLLAEEILAAKKLPYCDTNFFRRTVENGVEVHPNNYKYSLVRAYLNGLDYYYDESSTETIKKTDYTNRGFLQTAFTTNAQLLIAETVVDNSEDSTTDAENNIQKATAYACENTTDKLFLLSQKEATTSVYGFDLYNSNGTGNTRIRFTTDYARANYLYQNPNTEYGGLWWLRSPCVNDNDTDRVRFVTYDGEVVTIWVTSMQVGIVPALTIGF